MSVSRAIPRTCMSFLTFCGRLGSKWVKWELSHFLPSNSTRKETREGDKQSILKSMKEEIAREADPILESSPLLPVFSLGKGVIWS